METKSWPPPTAAAELTDPPAILGTAALDTLEHFSLGQSPGAANNLIFLI